MPSMPALRRVPVNEIRPGHVTWRPDETGRLIPDEEIRDYFPTGKTLNPAFKTKSGKLIVYLHGCMEWVSERK